MSLEERVTEVLAGHRLVFQADGDYCERTWFECSCSSVSGDVWTGASAEEHETHQADALSALIQEAQAEALREAADAIDAQRDATNPDLKPEDGWSVIDHRAGRFLGKTVAAKLVRARADKLEGK